MSYGQKLFPPIYEIQTLDVFAPPHTAREESCGSSEWVLQLLSYGRPLWGAHHAVQDPSKNLIESLLVLAFDKTRGDGPVKSLTLLSYRT